MRYAAMQKSYLSKLDSFDHSAVDSQPIVGLAGQWSARVRSQVNAHDVTHRGDPKQMKNISGITVNTRP